jgi:hypothetical protein
MWANRRSRESKVTRLLDKHRPRSTHEPRPVAHFMGSRRFPEVFGQLPVPASGLPEDSC